MRFIALALAALMSVTSPAAAQSTHWKTVGWWDVSYHTEYGGCASIAQFQNGTYVFIGLDTTANENLNLRVAIANEKWSSITPDDSYDVVVRFDRRGPWDVTMYGMQVDAAYGLYNIFPATSDNSARWLREFRRGVTMVWSYQGNELGSFSLKSTNLAVQEVIACTETYMKTHGTGDPFSGGNSGDPFQ